MQQLRTTFKTCISIRMLKILEILLYIFLTNMLLCTLHVVFVVFICSVWHAHVSSCAIVILYSSHPVPHPIQLLLQELYASPVYQAQTETIERSQLTGSSLQTSSPTAFHRIRFYFHSLWGPEQPFFPVVCHKP